MFSHFFAVPQKVLWKASVKPFEAPQRHVKIKIYLNFFSSSGIEQEGLSFNYYFVLDVHLNWFNWSYFLILGGGLLVILIDCINFSVKIPRYYKGVYIKSFFFRRARLWNFLPIECFPLTFDLNGFKSRINRHYLTVGSFLTDVLYILIFLCFFFL